MGEVENYRQDGNTSVLAFNPGHDGAIVLLKDFALVFSIEGEKESFQRHAVATPDLLLDALQRIREIPSVVAVGGWHPDGNRGKCLGTGYRGTDNEFATLQESRLLGNKTLLFQSTHERSHIFCSYGLSPFAQGQPCYALLWEGSIGAFYEIDENVNIHKLDEVLTFPGYKYTFLFDLADPSRVTAGWSFDGAGKLMALSAFSTRTTATPAEDKIIRQILTTVTPPTPKSRFAGSNYLDCRVTAPHFKELAGKFADRMFDIFFQYASRNLRKPWPLLICGGCGLNCEWNTRWRESGFFADVFVPPVANDSGSALGTAIEAQHMVTGNAKISWNVYSGLDFVWNGCPSDFQEFDADMATIARYLANGKVVAWVQGRSEIGPRALGNRSLLAAPFSKQMAARLNWIKEREDYRPIAPVCLEEDGMCHFGVGNGGSPHMLHFYKTNSPELQAVTHVDGSARVQTVSRKDNAPLHELLNLFKGMTGVGVLCNTSLNWPGKGFINESGDLFRYAAARQIDAVVVNRKLYLAADTEQMRELGRTGKYRDQVTAMPTLAQNARRPPQA